MAKGGAQQPGRTAARGGVDKLKITAYSDPGFNTLAGTSPNPIWVMINPNRYSEGTGVSYTDQSAAGGTGRQRVYNRTRGEALNLQLVLDGTGTVPDAPDKTVKAQLDDLRRLAVSTNGTIHSPNYLILAWGTLLFKGRLQTLKVDYTLFAPDGTPLRAKVDASFISFRNAADSAREQNRSSPDMTHAVTVAAGDSLPTLCHRIYGDSRYYLAIAQHNRLDDFRALEPGSLLTFPPLAAAAS